MESSKGVIKRKSKGDPMKPQRKGPATVTKRFKWDPMIPRERGLATVTKRGDLTGIHGAQEKGVQQGYQEEEI